MAGAVGEVAVRVYADYAGHATPTEVLPVIDGCHNELDTPSAAALSELIERLTRRRLTDPDQPRPGHGLDKSVTWRLKPT